MKTATKRKASPRKQAPPAKPKPQTKAALKELAKKVAAATQKMTVRWTQGDVLTKLVEADKAKPGLPPFDLVKKAVGADIAAQTFGQVTQKKLPLKAKTGSELTLELCNLEQRLRKEKAELGTAIADKEAATNRVKGCQEKVATTYDAISECLYDLRKGQGRISFPAPKKADEAKGNGKA